MLTRAENELITQTGPGTPMGGLMRRYWIPALLSSALPKPDSDPVRVRLLGENFVAFRDSNGGVGFLDEYCTHRGASLALGRVEDCGIRCLYHGWKFGIDGTIQDTPNISETSIREKLKAPAYPVCEGGGFVWVYLGPRDKQPPIPNFPFMTLDKAHYANFRVVANVNWLQVLEGGLDSSHIAFLHANSIPPQQTRTLEGREFTFKSTDVTPLLEVENTDFGFHYAAIRKIDGEPTLKWVRITGFNMPMATMIPMAISLNIEDEKGYHFGGGYHLIFHVPIDDTHMAYMKVNWDVERAVDQSHIERSNTSLGYGFPGAFDGDHYLGNADNKWLQDRSTLDKSFSGFGPGLANMEDFSMTNSMGAIFDRSREHVVSSDLAVIRLRRMLIEAARQLENGLEPISLTSDKAKIFATDGVLEHSTAWQSLVPNNLVLEDSQRPSAQMVPVA